MRSAILASLLALPIPALAAENVSVTGEVIDTWCYFSSVMGPPEAVVGSAHHTCAMWCAAGGIPVGLRAEDGTVYMVLKWEGEDTATGSRAILDTQSYTMTVNGEMHERDGIKYLLVAEVTEKGEITNTHDEWGVIPGFALPEPAQ
ncbi:hypothetical protein [Algicella marina]|uniref:Uncharacterized protein n=1 Tax=Algicella marina TaxID=2683284 RepID=A0A6P1SZF9_9RHOB|nr:hypothetical protein [Algicella marina]QHQ34743.1 hypothetical protein GO499_05815 [Algicella marina]